MWLLAGLALAAPPWAAELATGHCAAVVAALPDPQSDAERLAAGRCLVRLGQPGRALEVLGPVEGELVPYARLLQARVDLDRADPSAALARLEGVALAGDEEELLRGRAAAEAGRAELARTTLEPLLAGGHADEARWWLGRAAEAAEDRAGALTRYRELWTRHPTSAWSELAAGRLAGLAAPVPDLGSAAGRALVLERARTLLRARQAELAVPLLDALHAADPFDAPEEVLRMATALADARLHARAVEWYQRAGAATLGPKTAFAEALSTARSGDYPGAAEKYRALARRWPDTPEADEATFKPPYMDYDAGNLEAAVVGFGEYLAARPGGRFAGDARWFRAWAKWKLGDRAGALAGFEEVIRAGTDLAVGARYWKARATDDRAALDALLRASPETGYGWFAAQQLGVRYPVPAAVDPPTFPEAFLAPRPGLRRALRLLDAGLVDWARPLVDANVEAASRGGRETALPMAALLVAVERYQAAQALAKPWCGEAAAREACVPRPHGATVQRLAREAGLHPLLPFAIMTAESGLDPSVTSPAGARGLMQLMPTLATTLAPGRVDAFGIDDLYDAGVNARLGTSELVELHRRFRDAAVRPSLPLVIAGYNGGAPAVERWLAGYAAAPEADRFAEDISYTETRRYVRRVLGYLQRYRRAWGDG